MKIIGMMLLLVGVVAVASAQNCGDCISAPEIDASYAVSALALLSGSLVMLGSRRKK